MIFKPASPVNCSTSGCSSSHTSTSGNGNRIVTSFLPSTPNFFVDFFTHVWYLSAIAALLSKRVLTPDSIRVRVESRYFLLQVSTKGGTTSQRWSLKLSVGVAHSAWQAPMIRTRLLRCRY